MPERPKRRKNKNKRKNNKNNRSDANQNQIEINESVITESGSDLKENVIDSDIAQPKEEIKDEATNPNSLSFSNTHLETISFDKIITYNNKEECSKNNNSIESPSYIVETPEQANKTKPKLGNSMKSKSCDNDDSPTIVEVTDDLSVETDVKKCIPIIDSNNVIITENESLIKWENVDDFKSPKTELIENVLSSITIPLNIAHCEQTKILSPEEESSLRNYLQTLNLSTNSANLDVGDIKTEIEQIINREVKYRLRRKGFTDDIIYSRPGPSRSLAVIDEESGESSKASRRQSSLSDKKSDNEELEDEVFETKQTQALKNVSTDVMTKLTSKHLIPQKCIRVDAILREPEITEARGDWTMETVEKLAGAELIYLTDSSSSTSSIYEANDDISAEEDTDVSVRMITPTIEVTDTDTLLSNTFLVIDKNPKDEPQKNEIDVLEGKNTEVYSSNNSCSGENSHEIVILSTDDLKTNLYVKDLEDVTSKYDRQNNGINDEHEAIKPSTKNPNEIDEYDLEIKVLKCELNDAINNLIKEVTSDSENGSECNKDTFKRQDSSSSIDSSQCTAKYNPTHSSLNDVSNLIQESESDNVNKENTEHSTVGSHVKEVIKNIASKIQRHDTGINGDKKYPFTLRDICLKKISSFPFGDKILEELANVSQRLQKSVLATQNAHVKKQDKSNNIVVCDKIVLPHKEKTQIPPPVYPRKSSLKISQDEQCKPISSSRTETVYECLSPSQKMLMEKTNTVISKNDIVQKGHAFSSVSESQNSIQNKFDITPMKSETGSRLLALLRDTSNPAKFNSTVNALHEKQFSATKQFNMESSSKRLLDEIDSTTMPFYNKDNRLFSSENSHPFLRPTQNNISSYFYESDSGIREDPLSDLSTFKRNNISSYSYESDSGIREHSFHTLQSSKKHLYHSTGNLNKDIESDISSIQNMHRYCTNLRDRRNEEILPRRPSLPKDLCDQQMEYIRQKEKEVDAEIQRLEKEKNKASYTNRGPRAPMVSDSEIEDNRIFDLSKRNFIKRNYVPMYPSTANIERRKISSLFSSSEEELLREKMYAEYVNRMAEREQRKQHKVIKVTQTPIHSNMPSRSMPLLESFNSKMNNRIEQEFISKAKERWCKLGIQDSETEDEKENDINIYMEPKVIKHNIKVIDSGEEKDVRKLPSHMQEFVKFTVNDKDDDNDSTGESEKASAHVVVFCAVIILVLTVGKFLLRLFRNQ